MEKQPGKLSGSQTSAVADAMLAEHVTTQRDTRQRIERNKTPAAKGRVLGWFSLVAAIFGAGSR
jgi:hypothetical protein